MDGIARVTLLQIARQFRPQTPPSNPGVPFPITADYPRDKWRLQLRLYSYALCHPIRFRTLLALRLMFLFIGYDYPGIVYP